MTSVIRHVFDNGLTLLLIESHHAPVVSFNICVRVGSYDETDEEAGICHLIEHMLFKGTRQLAPGEVAKKIEAKGGEINAYTSFDETVYHCTLSSRHGREGLEILTDAVFDSVFDATELAREKEVVIEEILRSKDSPGKVLSEAVFKKSFGRHPYGRPILGWKQSVSGFSREQVVAFWQRWYVPQNIVVVAAGDFRPEAMLHACSLRLASLPAVTAPSSVASETPRQRQPQAVALSHPIQGSHMMMAYRGPTLDDPDLPALDVLSHLLGEGESSRLEMQVKEKRGLVNSVYSYVYSPKRPGLFMVGYTLPDRHIARATEAVLQEIDFLKEHKVDDAALARAKINIKSDAVYEKETVEGLAGKYGYFETLLQQYHFDETYYRQIDAVDPEAVRKVAENYLGSDRLTLGLLHPQLAKKSWQAESLLEIVRSKKTRKRRVATAKPDETAHYIKLSNGLTLILKENHHVPTVVIRTAHRGGLRAENSRTHGIHTFLSQVWGKSTAKLCAEDMAQAVESIAGNLQAYNGKNTCGMKADFLSEKTAEGLNLFLDALLCPRFDGDEIERERQHLLEAIRREEDQVSSVAFKQFLKTLYPKHPYGFSLLGHPDNIRRFQAKDLTAAHRACLDPKHAVISVVGDFDWKKMQKALAEPLEALRSPRQTLPRPPAQLAPASIRRAEQVKEKLQAHLVLGFQGLDYRDPDRYALDVLNNILAGQGGRLFIELRDKLSLAYSVTSLVQEGVEPGYFAVYIATEGSKLTDAIEGIQLELEKITRQTVSGAELDRAKQYMIGNYEIDLQRNSAVASQLLFNEFYGLSRQECRDWPAKILRVSAKDVLKVARRVLRLDRYVLSIVKPALSNDPILTGQKATTHERPKISPQK